MYESTQKRGEYALSPTAWLPTDEHLLCQFPIFIRLHLTDVLSRPPPCRFEIRQVQTYKGSDERANCCWVL